MPLGTIQQAIKLIASGINPKSAYTYYFATSIPSYQTGYTVPFSTSPTTPGSYTLNPAHFVNLTSTAESAFATALTSIDKVADTGVLFSYLNSASADIVVSGLNVALYDHGGTIVGQVGAFAQHPINASGAFASDIWIVQGGMINVSTLQRAVQHELLHTVGLRDVTSASASPVYVGDEDSGQYTIMSYEPHPEEGRRVTELQLYDIAALQATYGRDDSHNSGDTTISQFTETAGPHSGLGRIFSIWDGGGADTINASGTSRVLMDLRPAHFSSIGPNARVDLTAGAAPVLVDPGKYNISIAFGAYIENAKGSSAGDLIVGNLLTNKLEGGAGDDVIYAEGADSIHEAGDGAYGRVTSAGASKLEAPPATIQAFIDDKTKQEDHLLGGAGDDHLRGGRGDDLIEGGADDDYIIGGGGDDVIWGGEKDATTNDSGDTDTVDYSSNSTPIVIRFHGEAGATPLLTVNDGTGGTDTLHWIDRIVATSGVDHLNLSGVIPAGYDHLTIDMGGGVDVVANASEATGAIIVQIAENGTGTARSPNGGTINLLNAKTSIIASDYDDEITDLAVHDGLKRIDGGAGDDEITIGGSKGMLIGGEGDDKITGGDGHDVIVGDSASAFVGAWTNELKGGKGSDYILSTGQDDDVFGGDDADLIEVRGTAIVRGGKGNDIIDARSLGFDQSFSLRIKAEDDGNDVVLSTKTGAVLEAGFDIVFDGISLSDVTIIWDVTPDGEGYFEGPGDAVVLIESTGAALFIPRVYGHMIFENGENNHYTPNGLHLRINGQNFYQYYHQDIKVIAGDTSAYATPSTDHANATALPPGAGNGTPGDDELGGGSSNDAISAGGGNDSIRSSGGNDTIDGGSGTDTLSLFGARASFTFTRDASTGIVTALDTSGLEGRMTLTAMEAVTFATDNETYTIGDLVGYFGTDGNDALIEGSERDNFLYGLAGNDSLSGLGGNDWLDGGLGADAMTGGAGDDFFVVDNVGDNVVEAVGGGAGDYVLSYVSWSLAQGAEVETLSTASHSATAAIDLTGNAFGQDLIGNEGANILNGGGGADRLIGLGGDDFHVIDNAADSVIEFGGDGADYVLAYVSWTLAAGQEVETVSTASHSGTDAIDLTGNEFGQDLIGNDGANVLNGGAGADRLLGLGGADMFAFTTALGGGNVDQILDMNVGTDKIALDDAVFTGLALGALAAGAFRTGAAALDADDRILYDAATGALSFDADGAGGAAAVQFATLSAGLAMTANEFTVI